MSRHGHCGCPLWTRGINTALELGLAFGWHRIWYVYGYGKVLFCLRSIPLPNLWLSHIQRQIINSRFTLGFIIGSNAPHVFIHALSYYVYRKLTWPLRTRRLFRRIYSGDMPMATHHVSRIPLPKESRHEIWPHSIALDDIGSSHCSFFRYIPLPSKAGVNLIAILINEINVMTSRPGDPWRLSQISIPSFTQLLHVSTASSSGHENRSGDAVMCEVNHWRWTTDFLPVIPLHQSYIDWLIYVG